MSATILDRPPLKGATNAMLAGAPHRIGSVTLVVRDLDRIVDFYVGAIGLAVLDRSANGARLGVGDVTLVALRRDPAALRSTPRDAGLFHTAFLLPERADLSAWLRHAASLRVPLQGASDHLVSEALYLSDPEGNGIELYVDAPWYINQPFGVALDLDKPNEVIEAETKDLVSAEPSFQLRGDWADDLRRKLEPAVAA